VTNCHLQQTLVTFVIKNHITHFLVTFMTMLQLFMVFHSSNEMIFHVVFLLETFIWPISYKSDQKMITNIYLYIKLCMLLILYMVSCVLCHGN
jgi:hypothetical protein